MMKNLKKSFGLSTHLVLLVPLLLIGQAAPGHAQRIRSDAYYGKPFGVGRVTIPTLRGEPVLPVSDERFSVVEPHGRAMYPVLRNEPVREFLRGLLQIETPPNVTIYYLFAGDDPFDLSIYTPTEQGIHVVPEQDPQAHGELLEEWWNQYTARWRRLMNRGEYPPIAENFLVAMLGRRLDLRLPQGVGSLLPWTKQPTTAMEELLAAPSYRLQIDRQLVWPVLRPEGPLEPLPEYQIESRTNPLEEPDEVEVIEALAQRVPAECFYVRFGNFSNYLWFRDFNLMWQGDMGNMLMRRGFRSNAADRIEQQLSLSYNELARVLGPQVVQDIALIGLDPYFRQGPAIGALLQARNEFLLNQDLMRQRREALTKFPEATEETLEIRGQEVSLISTPDGQVRSYYVRDDGFHLVTTSRTLVERFLEVAEGGDAMSDLVSFQQARVEYPVANDDQVFVFVSQEFFQNLASPHYRVELRRRTRASREPLLLELAGYAHAMETRAGQQNEGALGDILPEDFAARWDGSRLQETDSGLVDTRRGTPGHFLPIADVEVEQVSAEELDIYHRFINRLQGEVGSMPALTLTLHRYQHAEAESETFALSALAYPLEDVRLGRFMNNLGEPYANRLAAVKGNVAAAEASLNVPVPLIGGERQPHILFAGLRDFLSPLAVRRGALVAGVEYSELIRGYVGTWPRPGLLQGFIKEANPIGPEPQPAEGDLWQTSLEDFLLMSFKPEVLNQVGPQLKWIEAERPAQVRLRVADLTGTKFARNVNTIGYMLTRQTSVAASRMMNALANQLDVPREQCRELTEMLIDGVFQCPLGGEYQLVAPPNGLEVWISSRLPEENRFLLTKIPEDFQLPFLSWFRGLSAELLIEEDQLEIHADLEIASDAIP